MTFAATGLTSCEQVGVDDLDPRITTGTDLGIVAQHVGAPAISAAASGASENPPTAKELLPVAGELTPVDDRHRLGRHAAPDSGQDSTVEPSGHDSPPPVPGTGGGGGTRPPTERPGAGGGEAEYPGEGDGGDDEFSWLQPTPYVPGRFVGVAKVPGRAAEMPAAHAAPEASEIEPSAADARRDPEALRARYASLGAAMRRIRQAGEAGQPAEESPQAQSPGYQARVEAERSFWERKLQDYTAYKAGLFAGPDTRERRMEMEAADRAIAAAEAAIANPESVMQQPQEGSSPVGEAVLREVVRKLREP